MTCAVCGYVETSDNPFIGVFAFGTSLNDTTGKECALFACPICKTIKFTNDRKYIINSKEQYKAKMKAERNL